MMDNATKKRVQYFRDAIFPQATLFVIVLIFSLIGGTSFSDMISSTLIGNALTLLLLSLGMSIIMMTGGFDFSIGYQISLISVLLTLLAQLGIGGISAIFLALIAGMIMGGINGSLIAYAKMPAFAVTLATQIIFRGFSYLLSQNRITAFFPDVVYRMFRFNVLGIPVYCIFLLAIVALIVCFLKFTFAGLYLRSINLNAEHAEQMGIPVRKVKLFSYTLMGILCAICSMIITSKNGYAGSSVGNGMEITIILIAYIGGVSGRNRRIRTWRLTLTTLVMSIIDSQFSVSSQAGSVQYILMGVFVLISLIRYKE